METKRLLMVALSIAIIFTQEQLLMFIPNVQLTVLLIILFVSVFSFKESMIMITAYVFLDSLYMGGFNVFYMVPMMLAWYLIPLSYHTILRQTKSELKLAIFALVFGFVYGWMFIPFNMIQTGIPNFIPYLIADLPFELIMATTGFLTVLWIYKPLYITLTEVIVINPNSTIIKSYK
ncbi:MAG: hypothetical protein KAJ22_00890 [Candidatus Izimaplasma sp.]|nr:hypothetical protein [Candidatus Izimaplasma bacterium]